MQQREDGQPIRRALRGRITLHAGAVCEKKRDRGLMTPFVPPPRTHTHTKLDAQTYSGGAGEKTYARPIQYGGGGGGGAGQKNRRH